MPSPKLSLQAEPPERSSVVDDTPRAMSPREERRVIEPRTAARRQRRSARMRLRASSSGQALVEFALVVPMALLLFVGIIEVSHYYYARLTLRHSVLEATRFAVTGSQLEDAESGDTLTRAESITRILQSAAPALPVDLERLSIEPPDGGGPGEIVRLSATYSYGFSLPLIRKFFPERVEFTVTSAMKNEPIFQ